MAVAPKQPKNPITAVNNFVGGLASRLSTPSASSPAPQSTGRVFGPIAPPTSTPSTRITPDGTALIPQIGPNSVVTRPNTGNAGPDPAEIAKLNEGVFGVDRFSSPEVIQQFEQETGQKIDRGPIANTQSGPLSAPGSSLSDQDLQDVLEVTRAPATENAQSGQQSIPDPGSDLFADSNSAVQEEEDITNELDSLAVPSPETERLEQLEQEMYDLIDERVKELDSRLESDLSSINQQFDKAEEDLAFAQAQEKGTTAVGLQRIGGFLGNSASAIGAMNNLARTHRNETMALQGLRASALQEARNAAADQRFELASLRIQEAKSIEQEIYNRRQDFFGNMLKLSEESRSDARFESEQIKERMDAFAKVAEVGGQLDPVAAAEIDKYYGVEGFSQKYADVIKSAAADEKAENALERQTKLLGLLQDIPAGKTITFPDGTEYTGIGSANDIVTSIQKNSQTGEATLIRVDKRTGEITTTGIGNFGAEGGGAGGSGFVAPQINAFNSAGLPAQELEGLAIQRAGALGTGGERDSARASLEVLNLTEEVSNLLQQEGVDVGFALGKIREGLSVNLANNQISLTPGTRSFSLTNKQEDLLNAKITLLTANFIKSISGAQVSDAERQFLLQASTSEGKSLQANMAALMALTDAANSNLRYKIDLDTRGLSTLSDNQGERGTQSGGSSTPGTFEVGGKTYDLPNG